LRRQLLPGLLAELVVDPRRHELRQLLAGLVALAELVERRGQEPARLRLERRPAAQPDAAGQETGRVLVLAAQRLQLAAPEERLAVRLLGRERLLPALDEVQGRPVVAAGDVLAD